jgi:hypothetical protein
MAKKDKEPKDPSRGAIGHLLNAARRVSKSVLGDDPVEMAGMAYGATAEGLKNVGSSTLGATVRKFNEAIPFIERAGYTIEEVELSLGISPRIMPHLVPTHTLSEEEKVELLAEVRGRTFITTVLNALFKAGDVATGIKFDGFTFMRLEIDVSILPAITLRFGKNDGDVELLEGPENTEEE